MESQIFATHLRRLRQHAGLSVAALAEAAGLQRTHVYQLESGVRSQPRLATLQALAHALGVRVDDLLS